MVKDLAYFKSERFIHDSLAGYAEKLVEGMRVEWRKHQQVDRFAIAWPRETIHADDGSAIDRAVMMSLPQELSATSLRGALERLVVRTKAYGVVVVEQHGEELRVVFETQHGARAWLIPLERHGDVLVPGTTRATENAESLGLLWKVRPAAAAP